MRSRKIAVIAVDQPEEVASLLLSWNRAHVLGISNNKGYGCCVDIFDLELGDTVESLVCESAGDLDASALRFGLERDGVLSAVLHHRFRNAEPDAPPNGGPATPVANSGGSEGPPSVS